jgi:ribose transport system permease protein
MDKPPERARHAELIRLLGKSGLLGVLILLCILAVCVSPQFLKLSNLVNVLRQMALYGVVSIGMTFVILTAGIDLSVGSIIGIVAIIVTQLLNAGMTPALAMVIALIAGSALGVFNGLGITLGRIPAFIMTLGVMVMGRGLAMTLANGEPISLSDPATKAIGWIGTGFFLTIPVPVWIFASVALVLFVKTSVYVVSGLLAALTAIIFVARLSVAEPTAGTGIELEAIAISVIGGASLFGGEGTISGTILGAAILAVLANILNLTGVSPFTQQIVKGAIIIAAVSLEILKERKR